MHLLTLNVDSVTLMCALCDYVNRIEHSTTADRNQLKKIKSREEKIFDKVTKLQESRTSRMTILKGEDEDKLVTDACKGLRKDLSSLQQELIVAINEEEEARKVYFT